MQDYALSEGPLEFPMVGWPYYVRNPFVAKDADTTYTGQHVANVSFVGLNYPTMKEQCGVKIVRFELALLQKHQMENLV